MKYEVSCNVKVIAEGGLSDSRCNNIESDVLDKVEACAHLDLIVENEHIVRNVENLPCCVVGENLWSEECWVLLLYEE